MNMQEFYKEYNLNKYNFAEIARVGTRTLIKYANGESIREDSRLRIEKAIYIVKENNLVYPRYTGKPGAVNEYVTHRKEVMNYMKTFKDLLGEGP